MKPEREHGADPRQEPMTPEERKLRTRFQELAAHDRRNAPDFAKMWTAPRPIRSPRRIVASATTLAAAAMVLVWCGAHSMVSPSESAPAAAPAAAAAPVLGDRGDEAALDPAPLDFLLDVPGSAPRSARISFDSNPIHGW